MQLDPHSIYEKLVTLGDDWAEKRYAAELLEETRKPLLSKLASSSSEKLQGAREAYALGHADYKEHIEKTAKANKDELRARVRYNAAITWADLQRTVAANERAASRLGT